MTIGTGVAALWFASDVSVISGFAGLVVPSLILVLASYTRCAVAFQRPALVEERAERILEVRLRARARRLGSVLEANRVLMEMASAGHLKLFGRPKGTLVTLWTASENVRLARVDTAGLKRLAEDIRRSTTAPAPTSPAHPTSLAGPSSVSLRLHTLVGGGVLLGGAIASLEGQQHVSQARLKAWRTALHACLELVPNE